MDIYTLTPEGFGANCYVLISEHHSAVVDPSVDADRILSFLEGKHATLDYILLTHGHFDHVTSLDTLRDLTGAPAYVHKDDNEMLQDGKKNAHALFFGQDKKWREAEGLLDDGDEIALGDEKIKVISTPGHSKGSVCLLCQDKLITGDTLFDGGYGRYDLHGGDPQKLSESLSALRELDGKLTIYPGHGGSNLLEIALDKIYYI